jgi:hypothetical protein
MKFVMEMNLIAYIAAAVYAMAVCLDMRINATSLQGSSFDRRAPVSRNNAFDRTLLIHDHDLGSHGRIVSIDGVARKPT